MKTEKVIQDIEKRYSRGFCEKRTSIRDDILMREKNIHKRWYIQDVVRHRKDAR